VVEAQGKRCLLFKGDLSDPQFCKEAVEGTVEGLGHLDILVPKGNSPTRVESWTGSLSPLID
jgi:hypothetical protein